MSLLQFFSLSPAPWDDFWYTATPGTQTVAGVRVDENTALTYSACWACTRVLSTGGAMAPLDLMRELDEGGSEPADDLRRYNLASNQFNPNMTNFMFRCRGISQQVNWGNAYAEIEFTNAGQVGAIHPIHASRIPAENVKRRDDGSVYYLVKNNNGTVTQLEADEVLHVPNPISDDGIVGKGVVTQARLSIGFGIATETQGAAYMGNSARPLVVIEGGKFKDKPDREEYRRQWMETFGGPANNAKPAFLPPDAKIHSLDFSAEDSQFLQTRQHNVEEVARWYGVPPHMIGHLLRSTYNNIEHQAIEYVRWTLKPLLVAWEQELDRKLLSMEERKTLYFCHDMNELERGDLQTWTTAMKDQFFNGKQTLNEWRAKDNQTPIGPAGDVHFVQQAMIPVEIAAKGPPEPAPAQPADAPPADNNAVRDTQKKLAAAILGDVMARMVSMEINAVKRVAEKATKFDVRLKEFYDKHSVTLARNLSAPLSAALSANDDQRDTSEVLSMIVSAHVAESMSQLNTLTDCTADQLEARVTQCVDGWYDRLSADLISQGTTHAN